jgi:hypothetical protein
VAEPVTLTPCARALVEPSRLWSRAEVLSKVAAVPSEPGVYAWYFRHAPGETPVNGCLVQQGCYLLYVGISPGRLISRENLRRRIVYHQRGNAEGSTLRLTLGCLLAAELGIELRRVGSGTRFTFAAGEKPLSQWMAHNALVIWCVTERPRPVENELLITSCCP